MGFFDSLTGKQKTTVPASGFYSQLSQFRDLYSELLNNANSLYNINSDQATKDFTPMPLTGGEQTAIDNIYRGFAPTEQSLRSDISMFMNPFDDYVINDINRQATGANSLVNQAATQAGQQGSNRSFLGTSDVEQNRLNSIGQFRQNQYNSSINNVLNSLIPQRQQDASNALTAGTYERGLDTQTRQAPYAALAAGQNSLAGFPTSFGNLGSREQVIKTGGGLGGFLNGPVGQIGLSALTGGGSALFGGSGLLGMNQALGSLGSSSAMGPYQGFFSDRRLKYDIEEYGEENGFKLYKFKYENGDGKDYIGVMADEVKKIMPEAVTQNGGYDMVNYDMIGVRFREAA